MAIYDILNKWFAFSGYDPDQTRFNLLSSEYTYHQTNKRIESLLKDYDPSGALAVIYAKAVFVNEMKDQKVALYNVLSDHSAWQQYQDAWNSFYSDEVISLETNFLDGLHRLICEITGKTMLGERDLDKERETVSGAIDRVCTSIDKLRLDVYRRGGNVQPIHKFATSISVFPTLAQCVLALEQAEDGIYLSYIRMGDTSDGYFGYFVKSGGNLFSLNERPDEAYVGQHSRSRNGRWSESKQYDIFPYRAMFDFAEHDYKGYAAIHKIDEGKLNFFDLGAEHYFPIVLTMVMLCQKYSGKSFTGTPLTYMDSLLPVNLEAAALTGADIAALIPMETSAVVQANRQLTLGFTTENVVSGELNRGFNYADNRNAPYYEVGTFPEQTADGYAQLLIDLYGDGFALDAGKLLSSNSTLRMLSPADESPSSGCAIPNVEFVGSQRRMELEAYRRARKQLAAYIEQKMVEEYKAFGGADAAQEWYRERVMQRKAFIEQLCVKLYVESKVAEKEAPEIYGAFDQVVGHEWSREDAVRLNESAGIDAWCYPDTKGKLPYRFSDGLYLNERATRTAYYYGGTTHEIPEDWTICDYTGKKASLYFVFRPENWRQLERLLGEAVPKLIKGWYSSSVSSTSGRPYSGNSILDATDAVLDLDTPLRALDRSYDNKFQKLGLGRHIDFSVAIGFSRNGFKRLLKQYASKDS